MQSNPAASTAPTSLLTCCRCGYRVEPLLTDARGRLVSGYALLQRHLESCRQAERVRLLLRPDRAL